MWALDCEESWSPKNWCFWTVVLEKTLESPLDCKEIQPVHSKGYQSWVFIGRTDAKAETPILWSLHVKSWLTGKDSDAGRDWGQEEKAMTEDEMAGWHHRLYGGGFEWTPGIGDGQGGLACCNSWGRKASDTTEWLNWIQVNWTLFDSTTVSLFPIPSGPYFTLYPTSIQWSFFTVIVISIITVTTSITLLHFLFILLIWKILAVRIFNPASTQLNVAGEKTLPYYPVFFSIHDCHPKLGSQRCQAIPPPVPDSVVLLNHYIIPFPFKSLKPLSTTLPSVDYFLHP